MVGFDKHPAWLPACLELYRLPPSKQFLVSENGAAGDLIHGLCTEGALSYWFKMQKIQSIYISKTEPYAGGAVRLKH